MVVTVVAIARVGILHARVSIRGLELVTSIGRNHKCLHEVVIEKFWQHSFAHPCIYSQHLLLQLLLHRRYIVLYLKHKIGVFVVQPGRKVHCIRGFRHRVFLDYGLEDKAVSYVLRVNNYLADKVFIVDCGSTYGKLFIAVESV